MTYIVGKKACKRVWNSNMELKIETIRPRGFQVWIKETKKSRSKTMVIVKIKGEQSKIKRKKEQKRTKAPFSESDHMVLNIRHKEPQIYRTILISFCM